MSRYSRPSISPNAWIGTMCGSRNRAAACASRRKRSRNSWSAARWAGNTFNATTRSSRVSKARSTSPMPPRAIGRSIRYGPNSEFT
jgi:hypothetical protein